MLRPHKAPAMPQDIVDRVMKVKTVEEYNTLREQLKEEYPLKDIYKLDVSGYLVKALKQNNPAEIRNNRERLKLIRMEAMAR